MNDIFNAKILIVDDEIELQKMLKTLLVNANFNNLYTASDGKIAISLTKEHEFNLILLDIMLPDTNGFELYEKLTKIKSTPVIFLSARDEDINKLRGLGLGADDYITKPFLPEELILRISAVLRRTFTPQYTRISLGNTTVDFDDLSCKNEDITHTLTATEFAILKKLFENRGKIVTIDNLCNAVWKEGNFGYENTLMVHIRRLREKIEENPSIPKHIVTIRGLGYKLSKESEDE